MANITPFYLKTLTLNGFPLLNAFTELVVYEDLFSTSLTGHIDIMETAFLRESLPIIGEEILFAEFASTLYTTPTPDEVISLVFKVTKLEGLNEAHKATGDAAVSEAQFTYRLHFQNLSDELNRVKRIRKAYKGTSSAIASTILQDMINQPFITLDGTKHDKEVVFPNWQPFKCINYLARMSISAQYNDPFYLFYMDREGYHFTSLSKLMDKAKKATVKKAIIQGLDDPMQDEYLLQGPVQFDPLFDTWDNELAGMYAGTLITYDKVFKRWEETTETYSGTYDQFKHVGKEKLNKIKPELPKSRYQFMMINEQTSPGIYINTKEWAIRSMLRSGQLRGMRTTFWLNRATNLHLGDVIDINHTNKTSDPDKVIGGKWLITRMKHVVTPMQYTCHVEAYKDGLG